ncbi:hypothetical protein [Pseudooceanicola algae]|uniref:Uncharacterized protein n=1 Tax=Pseudooceanicola algae TaxID=1537215 RepID=A0A418SDW2_9RHOB|nr:hypothetical protein [Pseudooceanicola algae]QPM89399.1 hypothetical protein PSAL_006150 [Pseudooceanicola algae]
MLLEFPSGVAYACQLSWQSIHILCVNPMGLRVRLPLAWDEGMSLIEIPSLPRECKSARELLVELSDFFDVPCSNYDAREFGAAQVAVRRKHETTLTKLADNMMDIYSDLSRYEERVRGR